MSARKKESVSDWNFACFPTKSNFCQRETIKKDLICDFSFHTQHVAKSLMIMSSHRIIMAET